MSSGATIIVVDDNATNLKLASDILELEGFVVHRSTDAETTLKLLEGIKPSLILMDIGLPGMDGLALTKLIRSREGGADIAIVALTAYATKGDREKVADAGCNGFISKPIDTRKFVAQVGKFLNPGT